MRRGYNNPLLLYNPSACSFKHPRRPQRAAAAASKHSRLPPLQTSYFASAAHDDVPCALLSAGLNPIPGTRVQQQVNFLGCLHFKTPAQQRGCCSSAGSQRNRTRYSSIIIKMRCQELGRIALVLPELRSIISMHGYAVQCLLERLRSYRLGFRVQGLGFRV